MANSKPIYPSQGEISRLYNLCDSGDFISAENFCRKLLANFPASAEGSKMLGVDLGAEGKTEEEFSHYKMAIKVNPDVAEAHYNLGNVLNLKGEMKEAISHYKMAIKINPD